MNKKLLIDILNCHIKSFCDAEKYAKLTGQRTPNDTANWSQILASALTGTIGLERKKGADLSDGSDVKGANVWSAIDTPRFNGVVPAGRVLTDYTNSSKIYPKIFFILWDYLSLTEKKNERCRIWCVRPKDDTKFLDVVDNWYKRKRKSNNFQLHPPRNKENNIFTNECGNLSYPLVFNATAHNKSYSIKYIDIDKINNGLCETV